MREVSKEGLDVAHGLVDKVGISQRLGSMISGVFSNLIDSVVPN